MFALWARDGLNILLSWYYISVIFLVGNVKWGFPQPCALSVWEQHHKRSKNLSKYSLRLIIKQPGSFTFGPRQAEIRPAVQKRRRADKDPPLWPWPLRSFFTCCRGIQATISSPCTFHAFPRPQKHSWRLRMVLNLIFMFAFCQTAIVWFCWSMVYQPLFQFKINILNFNSGNTTELIRGCFMDR